MLILLKKIQIIDVTSSHHNQIVDVLIKDGIIENIQQDINAQADFIVDNPELMLSAGWVDIFSNFCDPGFEYRENILSGSLAAIAGGFTNVFILPNTNPTISSQSEVSYVVEKSKYSPINLMPLGSITKKNEGAELSEMYNMQAIGAIAFTDGVKPVQAANLFLKALQYIKAFDGIVIQMPVDTSFNKSGLINEGIISTQLGLPGLPAFVENLFIKRDIELLKYTESKLHITGVTTIEGINLIDEAKKCGLKITCSVTPHHLLFCDEDIVSYDSNLKVNPPLRTRENMLNLRQAVLDGKVDCIASHHLPYHTDEKICEFEYAKNGIINLQTLFSSLNTVLPQLSNEKLVDLLTSNARKIFKLPLEKIEVGAKADFTIFDRKSSSVLTLENNKSKSTNSPFFNIKQQGKVVGTIHKGMLHLN